VIDSIQRPSNIWGSLTAWFEKVFAGINARESAKPHTTKSHHPGITQVVNARGCPPAKLQLLQMVAGFVVPANEKHWLRHLDFARIKPEEAAHCAVLQRALHTFKVLLVANSLKVATADDEINCNAANPLGLGHGGKDAIKLAMATSINCNP
jgi:hypothetical protein